jgi:hypothetical protein
MADLSFLRAIGSLSQPFSQTGMNDDRVLAAARLEKGKIFPLALASE